MSARAGWIPFLRHPRTMQELRRGAVRRKRAGLPTAWDDISRRTQRSWKEQRRLRWVRIGRV